MRGFDFEKSLTEENFAIGCLFFIKNKEMP
jgi:hypothetical protein